MPVKKITRADGFAVHRRRQVRLFKRQYPNTIQPKSKKLIKNLDVNLFTQLIFKALDKFNSLIIKHPKLANVTIHVGEKLVRLSDIMSKKIK